MKLKKNVAVSENGFVFNAERGESFSANEIGAEILQLLRGGKTIAEIEIHLLAHYEIDADTIEKDMYDFIRHLETNNLIEI